jgi:hypothetical protein
MIISQQFKDLYKTFIDEMLRANSLSVACKLIHEGSVFDECINCVTDPISHKSANIYKTGGPLAFADFQICPYCRGLGGVYKEAFDILDLLVVFDYKYWINFNSKIHSPDGLVQTISKFEDYQKIRSCNKIIIDTSIQNYTESYFQRNSDPQPCGLGENAYNFTFWKKI